MNFFKKILGSKEESVQPQPVAANDPLERYKAIPWMTQERLENVSICLNAGFIPAASLPTENDIELRSKEEIARRLHALKAIIIWCWATPEDVPDEVILNFIERNNLGDFLSDQEHEMLQTDRADEDMRRNLGWRFENCWPLAWYFGYQAPEITGAMMTGEQMSIILQHHTCDLDENITDWLLGVTCVNEQEVKAKEDLFYCIHNAVRSAQLGRPTVPEGFHPMMNGGVIHERRHSLSWMLSKGISWDDIELST